MVFFIVVAVLLHAPFLNSKRVLAELYDFPTSADLRPLGMRVA
jgi:hypothetical protein